MHDRFAAGFYNIHGQKASPLEVPYFFAKWKENCKKIKASCVKRFLKCIACERFQAALSQSARVGCSSTKILIRRHIHAARIPKKTPRISILKVIVYATPTRILFSNNQWSIPGSFRLSTFPNHGEKRQQNCIERFSDWSTWALPTKPWTGAFQTSKNYTIKIMHCSIDSRKRRDWFLNKLHS